MVEKNEIPWPEKFGIGIRNRVLGLNSCLEKLDEKITRLVMVTEARKKDNALSSLTIELFVLKMELEDAKKGMDEILVQYRDACDQNKEEEEDNVIKELKELIIEVYKLKCDIDEKVKGLNVRDHSEGESSQDLTAKEGGEDKDRKGKGLTIDDNDMIKFDTGQYGESSQARSFTELRKDAILTLSSSSTEEEITDEHEKKDGDVRKRFLNKVSEAFSLSETSENNDDVEQQASDSDYEVVGTVEELEEDLMQ